MRRVTTCPRGLALLLCLGLIGTGPIVACTPVGLVVGAGATVGVQAAQRRGLETAADDARITLAINDAWIGQDLGVWTGIDVTVVEGRALLTGYVADQDDRVEAVRAAWQVDGVTEVINEIHIGSGDLSQDTAHDTYIATTLRSRLTFDRDVSAIDYSIDVVGGVIYLSGIARDQVELDRVVSHGRDISYVRGVVPYVRILPADSGPAQTDQET